MPTTLSRRRVPAELLPRQITLKPSMIGVIVLAAMAGCTSPSAPSADTVSAGISDPAPTSEGSAVTDLTVESIEGSIVTLAFTEVADAGGTPADYKIRFQEAPMVWHTASDVVEGTCSGRLKGHTVGALRTCTVASLSAGIKYELQAIAINSSTSVVDGELSNVAEVTPEPEPAPSSVEGLITQHTFTSPLEDGWTDRGEGNYSHGFEDGDGYGQANYEPNLCVGCGPIQVRRGFDEVDEVTVEMRWQVSENMDYDTGSKVKKIFFLENPKTNPIYFALAGGYQLALFTQSTAEGASRLQGGPQITPGRVYDVKIYIKLNTVDAVGNSNPDGVGTVWLDGQRIIHRTDYRFRGEESPQRSSGQYFAASDGISGIRWNPTWPGGGDPPAEKMWERIYDIALWSGFHD